MEELGSKQKRFLRSKAHHLTPIFQIGKNGVNDELMIQIGEALEKRELIKVSLLQTCTETPEEAAAEIQEKVRCHVVQVIGRVIVLYRQSRNEKYQRVSEEVRLLTNKKGDRKMSTVHNQADVGQIASKVLMPGDPLRAKFIAETFLLNPKLVNEVRNMYAFTGTYNGNRVTIMASGMGMPSIGIYSYELFTNYQVDSIIRIGSAGSYVKELDVYDVVLASSAWSESSYARTQNGCEDDELFPSKELNDTIKSAANKLNTPLKEAKIHSSDVFYRDPSGGTFVELNQNHGVECVEMESFALFHNANVLEKKAACLLTISDSFVTNEATSPQERQEAFTQMIKVALETEI